METKNKLIDDTQQLVSASRSGCKIPIYDDGYGDLYIFRNTMGIQGIVRAASFTDAYSICEDEFQPEADMTIEEIREEYNFTTQRIKIINPSGSQTWKTVEIPGKDENAWTENELFQEGYGFRPNGQKVGDKHRHGIYSKDLNGEELVILTPKLANELEIALEITTDE